MATSTFSGQVQVPGNVAVDSSALVPGFIDVTSQQTSVNFTALKMKTSGDSVVPVQFTFIVPMSGTTISEVSAQLSFWTAKSPGAPYLPIPTGFGAIFEVIPTEEPTSSKTSSIVGAITTTTSPASQTSSSSSSVSSPSTRLSQPTHAASKEYTSAELAGAALGCGIGGALLVGLAAFFFLRKRKTRQSPDGTLGAAIGSGFTSGTGKGCIVTNIDYEDGLEMTANRWAKHLPQPESDQAIRNKANSILDAIATYVETFFQDKALIPLNPSAGRDLRGFDASHLPDTVTNLIQNSVKPTFLIKHCIANLIVSRTVLDSNNSEQSFLPESVTALKLSPDAQARPGCSEALSNWRVISAYLRQDPENDNEYQVERDRRIAAATTWLCSCFEPWTRNSSDSKRLQNLVGIMQRASELGILLLSQRASFEWQWQDQIRGDPKGQRNNSSRIVVLPGLYKMSGEDAVPLTNPLHLIEPRFA